MPAHFDDTLRPEVGDEHRARAERTQGIVADGGEIADPVAVVTTLDLEGSHLPGGEHVGRHGDREGREGPEWPRGRFVQRGDLGDRPPGVVVVQVPERRREQFGGIDDRAVIVGHGSALPAHPDLAGVNGAAAWCGLGRVRFAGRS